MAQAATSKLTVDDQAPSRTRWFRPNGCVCDREDGLHEVYVGGVLVGTYTHDLLGQRNALLVMLAEDRATRVKELATAFQITPEIIRRARRKYEREGMAAVVATRRAGAGAKVTPAVRRRVYASFDGGRNITSTAHLVRKQISYGTVWRLHKDWQAERLEAQVAEKTPVVASQVELPLGQASNDNDPEESPVDASAAEARRDASEGSAATTSPSVQSTAAVLEPADFQLEQQLEDGTDELGVEEALERGGQDVQHLGTWIMVAMLHALGVYRLAAGFGRGVVPMVALRVALDAVVMALSLGQRCVEGVRRLATPSAATLLRHVRAVSAEGTRQVLRRFAEEGGVLMHLGLARGLIQAGRRSRRRRRVVVYVDNHLRQYTGKHTVRKGWHMQDRRAVPGTSDYYAHDVDGNPLFRVDVPSHDSLCQWLRPIARFVRAALGSDDTVLLAFDRAGAFAAEMAALREERFEFVTYERAPYPLLTATAFNQELVVRRGQKCETISYCENRQKNLNRGRGRVRRICLRMPDGYQVNVLAISKLPAEHLIRVLLQRWGRQENQFKHEVERWGLNQLDGRKVESYPADQEIPNPAWRRLEYQLRFARAAEGRARNKLARLPADAPQRARYQADLNRSLEQQAELEAQRPHTPKRAAVSETELAGELVRHLRPYKTVIDTLRIALANVETELATLLASQLSKPREAKKTLGNLLAAPGTVRAAKRSLTVTLAPAGTAAERDAFKHLLHELTLRRLVLPGDPARRKLRFQLQQF